MEGADRLSIDSMAVTPRLRARLTRFLAENGLRWDDSVKSVIAVTDEDTIVACGGAADDVIKCVAVDRAYREYGLAATVVSRLLEKIVSAGYARAFLFTKPESAQSFQALGFRELARFQDSVMLENGTRTVRDYEALLTKDRADGVSGAIVMNANPFTLGHLHLIRTAAKTVDRLHVFLVREDRSAFPYEARYRLVREGTREIPNVTVHEGSAYVLSYATFPTYFLKDGADFAFVQAGLDLNLFARHIAPPLNITVRFAGEEPFSPETAAYNAGMRAILPEYGIRVEIIPRLRADGREISASRVRRLLRDGRVSDTRELVPESTYQYLLSREGQAVIETLKTQTQG